MSIPALVLATLICLSHSLSTLNNTLFPTCTLASPASTPALLLLAQHHTTPSRGLCQSLGMTPCGLTCCPLHHYLLRHTTVHDNYTAIEEMLCGGQMCSGRCCRGQCHRADSQGQLRQQELCSEAERDDEAECVAAGLLWCDGQCCGFGAQGHRCYKRNLYGTPYIRCPIQAPPS